MVMSLINQKESQHLPLIMAVDDEPINLFLLEDIVEDRYQLRLINNGKECLQAVNEQTPDLILLDINMSGLSGFEVCQRLKENPQTADIPIIFLTAMLSVEDEKRGLEMGAVDYITKPFSESILLARIETQLSLSSAKKIIEANNKALIREQRYISQIINSMREDPRFDNSNITQNLTSLEDSNGDIVLSASSANDSQHFMIGDFTGHGLTAAIAGPLVTSAFYSGVKNAFSPIDILQMLNFELFHKIPAQKFLVASYIEWHKDRRQLLVFNHGMPAIVVFKADKSIPKTVRSSGLPLGILEHEFEPKYNVVDFEEGDRLLVFTDGVIDPRNTKSPFVDEADFFDYVQKKWRGLDVNTECSLLAELKGDLESIKGADDLTLVEVFANY